MKREAVVPPVRLRRDETDEESREKGGVGEPRLQPKVVILDPEVTVETPAWLWAGTGMRALDHAVEASYSNRHTPISDALAARAIKLLNDHLKPSLQTAGEDRAKVVASYRDVLTLPGDPARGGAFALIALGGKTRSRNCCSVGWAMRSKPETRPCVASEICSSRTCTSLVRE